METTSQVDPSNIMQIGTGFFASKTLLTATKIGLFTLLGERPRSGEDIQKELGLHPRSLYDFLDALVALGFLNRKGIKETSIYSNSADSDLFLDKNKPSYMGGILEMANNRLYPFWNDLETGLKTGLPQNEAKNNGKSLFDAIYADPARLREFIRAMTGVQLGNFIAFAKQFDFTNYKTLCDIGGSGGALSAQVTLNNEHVKCTTLDLPPVTSIAQENMDAMGLGDKVNVVSGDFFADKFPKADIITMGQILHDWGTKDKKKLISKSY